MLKKPLTLAVLLISFLVLAASLIPNLAPRLRLLSAHFKPVTQTLHSVRYHTMSSPDYTKELHIALLAVQRATLLTKSVFHSHAKGTLDKADASPVTIGDFGAQALIISALQHNFPNDEIVAEEEAKDLREKVDQLDVHAFGSSEAEALSLQLTSLAMKTIGDESDTAISVRNLLSPRADI